MSKVYTTFFLIIVITVISTLIALPARAPYTFSLFGQERSITLGSPVIDFTLFGRRYYKEFALKQGLDIKGGIQLVLEANMTQIPEVDRTTALESVREIIYRRVDLFGLNEPVVQTTQQGESYRVLVELAGVTNPNEALELVGTTAQMDFRLQNNTELTASSSALEVYSSFEPVGLSGAELKRASVQFNQQTGQPVISLEFNETGTSIFGQITANNTGKALGIFIDGYPVMAPVIQDAIVTGQAMIEGGFTTEQAKQLAVQLNAGALPVPVTVVEQRTVEASLGQASVQESVRAGLIGLGLLMLFMTLMYGTKGVIANIALIIYTVLTIAIYKIIGVTLTVPGIAGLLLTIGMAVDSNILIFERMKEELRTGRAFKPAMELGFGRAWDSIKDANVVTICTALVLINPLNFAFLNTSGMVRGLGITLFIGVVISLFTGIVVTRTLMRVFLKG
ncbi:MAG: protein translocase subunit SecD [bacterium]|nr:protein translocase subunit SecD [bacterium]